MSAVQLYTAAHTDLAHVREFFEKNLLRENESAIAVFDGIFYAAKNERVGGLAFHDYLIFSDHSIYLWARGIHKDYLDRFDLARLSVSAKQTEEGFAAVNLIISLENGEELGLIFDLVPTDEAEKIVSLYFAIASELETSYGKSYRGEITKEVASKLIEIAQKNLPLITVPIPDKPTQKEQEISKEHIQDGDVQVHHGTMFYGDDMLSRIKRIRNGDEEEFANQGHSNSRQREPYTAEFLRNERRGNFQKPPTPDFQALFSKLDMVSLKRAEAITKDLLSNIPEQYREQAKKDLTEMPERMTSSFNAFNELLTNLAENPQAQNVVIQTIATAVKNDGIFGAMLKAMSLVQQTATKVVSPEGFQMPVEDPSTNGIKTEETAQPERKKRIKISVE